MNRHSVGDFGIGPYTQIADTVIAAGIPPYRGTPGSAPLLYAPKNGSSPKAPNWWGSGPNAIQTEITTLIYTILTTAHTVGIMRPFNFAYVVTAVARNTSTFVLDKDPGVYSTNYRYPVPHGAAPADVADNAIAGGDYVAYQLADGTWIFDTVSSGTYSALVLTTAVPDISTSGGVLAGTPMFFFGVIANSDPATGKPNPQLTVPASNSSTQNTYQSYTGALWSSLHPGDPLIAYSPNGTGAGVFDLIAGQYVGNS